MSKKKSIILIGLLLFGLLSYVLYTGYMYTISFYKHEHVKGVVIGLFENKPGIGATLQQIRTTDEEEIAEVIRLLESRTAIKLFPHTGPIKNYSSDSFELRIELISDNNLTLEYKMDSFGDVEVNKGFKHKRSNTLIFGGSGKLWFNDVRALFERKKQNLLWS
ncbi:hypothetical protein [Paenibacillus sp. GM2]|uniref:hypothetical protein n=1 Tax=Paenibacillus sp. GM2 TaxID=1622070 RepID=UPI000839BCAF|nr:hypothetical protein [Paenibacillus sp. GM2]